MIENVFIICSPVVLAYTKLGDFDRLKRAKSVYNFCWEGVLIQVGRSPPAPQRGKVDWGRFKLPGRMEEWKVGRLVDR